MMWLCLEARLPIPKIIAWLVVWQELAIELSFQKIVLSLGTVHNMYK